MSGSSLLGLVDNNSIYASTVTQYTGANRVASSATIEKTLTSNMQSAYSQQIEEMEDLLQEGRSGEALAKYNELCEYAKQNAELYNYDTVDDATVRSVVNNAYKAETGKTVMSSISKNTSSSFWRGFKDCWAFTDSDLTTEETKAKFQGVDVKDSNERDLKLGIAAGGVVTGVATGIGIGLLGSLADKVGSFASGGDALSTVKNIGIGVVKVANWLSTKLGGWGLVGLATGAAVAVGIHAYNKHKQAQAEAEE